MRVYYLQSEYQAGKHRIIKSAYSSERVDETTMSPFLTLDIDEDMNAALCADLSATQNRIDVAFDSKHYVNASGQLIRKDGWTEYMPEGF